MDINQCYIPTSDNDEEDKKDVYSRRLAIVQAGQDGILSLLRETSVPKSAEVATIRARRDHDIGQQRLGQVNDDGERFADDGERFADDGDRFADDGERFADDGERLADDGERFADGGERFADGGERFADDGERFADLCAAGNVVTGGSFFHHIRTHKVNWVSPDPSVKK
ncbi:hypothetical protein ACOMHN_003331 [Nucella lapillus]